MIPKKPDSITAEDARKLMEAFRKKPLQWISNIPPEADQLLMYIYKKGYNDVTRTRIEKYLKEKGLIK